jgi:hypothetical protein
MDANQEKIKGAKAMHMLATLQGQASKVLQEVPKGEMYEEIIGANDDRFGDQHLAIGCCNQLKTWTQEDGVVYPCGSLPPLTNRSPTAPFLH